MSSKNQLPKGGIQPKKKPATKSPAVSPLIIVGVMAAVILVVIGVVLLQSQSVRRPVTASGVSGEGSSWGPADAKVTILAFSDFNCSHCATFALNQGRQLKAEYESTGQVRFEFHSFLISGAVSANAANAALCAADQGRFWDYHDTLFSQQGVSASPFDKSLLKQYAAQLGLETGTFNLCIDRDSHLQEVYRDNSLGRTKGVNATPTFFVNGEKVEGAVPYQQLKATIDALLG